MVIEGFLRVDHVLEAVEQIGANVVVVGLLIELEKGLENLPLKRGMAATREKADSKPRREMRSPTTALHCLRTQYTGSWKQRMYYTEERGEKERGGGVR